MANEIPNVIHASGRVTYQPAPFGQTKATVESSSGIASIEHLADGVVLVGLSDAINKSERFVLATCQSNDENTGTTEAVSEEVTNLPPGLDPSAYIVFIATSRAADGVGTNSDRAFSFVVLRSSVGVNPIDSLPFGGP